MRILVVEDNPLTADLLAMALPHSGFSSLAVACDGAQALTRLRMEYYDACLLDLRMPVMDGIDMLRALTPEEVPVVIFTAASQPEIDDVAAEFPDVIVLRKPADAPEILAALRRAVNRRPIAEE